MKRSARLVPLLNHLGFFRRGLGSAALLTLCAGCEIPPKGLRWPRLVGVLQAICACGVGGVVKEIKAAIWGLDMLPQSRHFHFAGFFLASEVQDKHEHHEQGTSPP